MRMNLAEIALSLHCTPQSLLSPSSPDGGEDGIPGEGDGSSFEVQYVRLEKTTSWASYVPTGACIDSREIQKGQLFFCLPGERTDGHDFALDAARGGACAVVASRDPFAAVDRSALSFSLPPVFRVQDPLRAMWRLAMSHRDTALARVIGVTGTAGKTSVKEVLAHILSQHGHTERNPMNLNNQIGLPLSMLNASGDASFWVMELGISEARDMRELGSILRPDVGIILNVGKGHLSGLAERAERGERGVAANKALLLDHIQPGGLAIISADYPELLDAIEESHHKSLAHRGIELVSFSTQLRKLCGWAEYLGPGDDFSGRFRAAVAEKEFLLQTCFRGDFGCENVAAIAVAAIKTGLSFDEVIAGFSTAKLPGQRFNCRRYGNVTLVDDSYNANPLSALRMIEACRGMAEESSLPLVLVMGEMLELGEEAEASHVELGRAMAAAAPKTIFWKGGQAGAVLQGLREAGFTGDCYPVGGGQEFSLLLEELNLHSGLFLFKGSRRNHLERLVDILRETLAPTGEAHAV